MVTLINMSSGEKGDADTDIRVELRGPQTKMILTMVTELNLRRPQGRNILTTVSTRLNMTMNI